MAYASWSVVFGEQPTASKWNILGTNDASFNDGTGIGTNAIAAASLKTSAIKLGYAEITASISGVATSTSDVDMTGVTVTVTVPAGGRDLFIISAGGNYQQSGGIDTIYGVIKIKESTTVLNSTNVTPSAANLPYGWTVTHRVSAPSAGSHTYKIAVAQNSTGPTYTIGAAATNPTYIMALLI